MDLLEEVLGAASRRVPGEQMNHERQSCEPREQGYRGGIAREGEQRRGARKSEGQSQVVAGLLLHGNRSPARGGGARKAQSHDQDGDCESGHQSGVAERQGRGGGRDCHAEGDQEARSRIGGYEAGSTHTTNVLTVA